MGESCSKVLIAHDHPLVRSAFANSIEYKLYLTVVAQAQNGLEAIELAKQHNLDLILMDVRTPGLDLEFLAKGLTNIQIANRLHLSPHTIMSYVERIIKKLKVSDHTQSAVRAV